MPTDCIRTIDRSILKSFLLPFLSDYKQTRNSIVWIYQKIDVPRGRKWNIYEIVLYCFCDKNELKLTACYFGLSSLHECKKQSLGYLEWLCLLINQQLAVRKTAMNIVIIFSSERKKRGGWLCCGWLVRICMSKSTENICTGEELLFDEDEVNK